MKMLIAILLQAILVCSCISEPPCRFPVAKYATIRLNLDWGDTELPPEQMRLLFYTTNGQQPPILDFVEWQGGLVNMRFGDYDLVAVNNDTENIEYRGDDKFGTIEAYTQTVDADIIGGKLMIQPYNFYATSKRNIHLPESSDTTTITIEPVNMVQTIPYSFSRIEGMEYVSGIKIAVTGLATSVMLASGELSNEQAAVMCKFVRLKESIEGNFRTFGASPVAGSKNIFIIQFLYGAEIITRQYDVTRMLREKGRIDIEDYLKFEVIDGEGGGFDPGVGGWEQDDVDLKW